MMAGLRGVWVEGGGRGEDMQGYVKLLYSLSIMIFMQR